MINLGLIGNGFVGSSARQLECLENKVIVYDIIPEKCVPKGTTLQDICKCDLIFIAVPTPMQEDGTCYTKFVENIIDQVKDIQPDANIVIRSTCPPGFAESKGVHFMPEFLTEKNAKEDFRNNKIWVLGQNNQLKPIQDKLQTLFTNAKNESKIKSDTLQVVEPKEAEMIKYVRNTFLSVKVSYFNEVYQVCKTIGADYETVRKLACSDDRIGDSHTMVPGPDGKLGYGGHCFPKDVASWTTWSQQDNKYSIVKASQTRNVELDRENQDWKKDKGRAVI